MNNYFDHPGLSNSKLNFLRAELSGSDARDLTEAYRRGTLLDVLITDPKQLDTYQRTIGKYHYTEEEIREGLKMRKAFFDDPFCRQLHAESLLQEEVYDDVEFGDVVVGCKCKCDGRHKYGRWPWDLKRTSSSTQDQFEIAFDVYNYDQQGYFYSTVCQSDKMVFIAVNPKGKVFKIFIRRDDARWESGRSKVEEMVFKYVMLI
jgi:hypothetical protein